MPAAPLLARQRKVRRLQSGVTRASGTGDTLWHSKYDSQIASLAVPALFSIILVRFSTCSTCLMPEVLHTCSLPEVMCTLNEHDKLDAGPNYESCRHW